MNHRLKAIETVIRWYQETDVFLPDRAVERLVEVIQRLLEEVDDLPSPMAPLLLEDRRKEK